MGQSNILLGKIHWTSLKQDRIQDKQRFQNGMVDLYIERTHNFKFDAQAWFYDPASKVLCAIIGYISNLNAIKTKYRIEQQHDVEVVGQLYNLKQLAFIPELDGLFLGFIFDEPIQQGYLWQCQYGMSLPIYYTTTQEQCFFSTSLKRLLQCVSIQRELNLDAIHDFLHFENIIPNEATLIQQIKKLVPLRYLVIDCVTRSIQTKRLEVPSTRASKTVAKQQLLASIESHLLTLFHQLKSEESALTLTGGWDTNVILSVLRKASPHLITAATIDGGQGKNEIPAIKCILNHYQGVTHVTSELQEDLINVFPDLVWMLEGYVFDGSMFLRYQLARILSQTEIHTVFLGACADQVLYPRTIFKKIFQALPGTTWKDRLTRSLQKSKNWILKPERVKEKILRQQITKRLATVYSVTDFYHLDIDFLLKVHELILNGFGIQGLYPYLNRQTAELSRALGLSNRKKRLYKKQVKGALGPEITQYFEKSGSVSDTKSLFERNKDILLKIATSQFIHKVLTQAQINEIVKNPAEYHLLILQLVYLYLFNELFLSGQFDTQFNQAHCDLSLKAFLAS